jgi:hypothetical protein
MSCAFALGLIVHMMGGERSGDVLRVIGGLAMFFGGCGFFQDMGKRRRWGGSGGNGVGS